MTAKADRIERFGYVVAVGVLLVPVVGMLNALDARKAGRSLPVGPGLGARVEVEAEKCGFCTSDSCSAEPGNCSTCCKPALCACTETPAAHQ